MDTHILASASLDETIRNRIKAKAAFWSYLNELAVELMQADDEEIIPELTRTTIRLLFPYYTAAEILEEAKLLLITLKLSVPQHYTSLYQDSFAAVVDGKIKAGSRK
jgi:hypothetical protein